jgi:phage recombination protein Bet
MSREEKAAFLLVAQEYRLNPITREIYAMPKKGGGLIPVVSIDGWVRLANEHPQFDGMEFEDCHSETGELVSTTCRIFRKDRRHPICVTEYYDECKRETEPWKMKHRMLRHKAMIQCSRYAFGFAGIYDQDEAERFAEAGPVHQARRAPAPTAQLIEQRAEPVETHVPRRAPPPEIEPTAPAVSPLNAFRARAAEAQDTEQLGEAWNEIVEPLYDRMLPHEQDEYLAIIRTRTAELASDDDGGEAREP